MKVYIPQNFDDNGGVFGGLVKKRNAVEAGVFAGILFILARIIYAFFPSLMLMAVLIILGILGVAFLLCGFGDQSLMTIVADQIRYNKTKGVITLMRPSNEDHK